MIKKFNEHTPNTSAACFIADNASVIGDVTLCENASVWYGAVLRGDTSSIFIDSDSNIQDNAVLHCTSKFPIKIGKNVTVGHNATIHGATLCDNVLIGMGAIVLNGARIGKNSIIAAGALVKENTEIPENSLVVGIPAKVIRPLSDDQKALIAGNAAHYVRLAEQHKNS